VKLAASSDLQPGSRAAHFTAKATTTALGPKRAAEPGGVGSAARVQGGARNSGGPSASPSSGQGASYKPEAKSAAVQRESEGVTVPKTGAQASRTNAVKNNAAGGKDPCGGRVGEAGKREGMAGTSGPNSPRRREPKDKVRQLQRRLCAAAKRHPERRFHALYDRIARRDVLAEAWKRVRQNKGAAGVDAQTIAALEAHGVDRLLGEIHDVLRAGTYRPAAVLRRYIPKADGKKRPLGIPTVRDRVVQMAAKLVLEPIFEAGFRSCSYGFRPKRSATEALETLRKLGAKGYSHVLDADIRDYFGSIDHDKLMKLVERRVSDRRVLKLLRQWLTAGVMEGGVVINPTSGTPQGGVISPLLSNIYLAVLDDVWTKRCAHLGELVRYADDFVVMCKTKRDVDEAEARVKHVMTRLGLELHPEKTRKIDLCWGKQGFDFLGCHLRKRLSGIIWEKARRRVYFLQRWPSARAMKRIRQRVKDLTPRSRCHADLREMIAQLNPVLRGWGGYFKTGNADVKFNQLDSYVYQRLRALRVKRAGSKLHAGQGERWTRDYFVKGFGLHRLRGTVRYPEAA
jgi:RNA-directed DNA polymerase